MAKVHACIRGGLNGANMKDLCKTILLTNTSPASTVVFGKVSTLTHETYGEEGEHLNEFMYGTDCLMRQANFTISCLAVTCAGHRLPGITL